MPVLISMMGGIWSRISDFFTGMFALIPQYMYFIYTCLASLLDALQFLARKLAGLDAYYVNGEKVSGDIIYSFISGILGINTDANYSALSTVFWSMIIFGAMLLVVSTIFAIIKAHYKDSASDTNPGPIIMSSIKTFFLMAIIPFASIFGILLSNLLLQTLDSITSPAGSSQLSAVYEHSSVDFASFFKSETTSTGGKAYASYDFFGAGAYTDSTTFSGVMFKLAARDANRVRKGSYTAAKESGSKWSDFGIFTSSADNGDVKREEVATMIDVAFANNLTMQDRRTPSLFGSESSVLISSFTYLQSAVWYTGIIQFKSFSKYNVGLVWYYYNLWSFNYFLGFAAMATALTFFSSVMFGLIVRMIECIALFLVFPPLVGMGPLDGNKAIDSWKKQFISDILMAYGAIVGLNLSFILLNEISKIQFFTKGILNELMEILLILVVLSTIKDLVKLVSGFVGGGDANATGEKTKSEVKDVATKAAKTTLKAAKVGVKVAGVAVPAFKGIAMAIDKIEKKIQAIKNEIAKKQQAEGIKKLQKEIEDKTKEAEEKEKEIASEEKESDNETAEFEAAFGDEEDLGAIDSDESKQRVKELADKHRQSDSNFDMDKLYKEYTDRYEEGAGEIDNDDSLTDEQKTAKKKELASNLKKETVAAFRENNNHRRSAKTKEQELDKTNNELDTAKENLDGVLDGKKVVADDGTVSDKSKKERGAIASAALDLAGQVFKLAGNVTGVASGFKKLDDAGVVDTGKEVIQEIVGKAVGKDGITYQKMLKGKSKLSTKDQKDDVDKAKNAAYVQSLQRQATASERMKREIMDLVNVISRDPSKIKPEVKDKIKDNAVAAKYTSKLKSSLSRALRDLEVSVPLGGFKDDKKGKQDEKKRLVDDFYKTKIAPAFMAEMKSFSGDPKDESAFAEAAIQRVLGRFSAELADLERDIKSIT